MLTEILLALLSFLVAFLGGFMALAGAFMFSDLKKRITGTILIVVGVAIWFVFPWVML